MCWDDKVDKLFDAISASRGVEDPAFMASVEALITMAEPALIRVLQFMDETVELASKNSLGYRAVYENRVFALVRMAQANPSTFIECAPGARWQSSVSILWALGSVEDPCVDAMSAETLERSPNARFRWAAAHWLSERGCVQAKKLLIRALADTDPIVALAAVGAMGKFGDSTAIAPLRDLASEHSAGPAVGVSRAALDALDRIVERNNESHG